MVEQILQTVGGELLVVIVIAQQINDDAGVEIARARPHWNAAGRSEAHRGIDRYPVTQRTETRSVAQMREDRSCGKLCTEAMHQRLVRNAVETITADALVEIALRQRKM